MQRLCSGEKGLCAPWVAVRTWMGCFGHFSPKPTLLFGDWQFLRLLKRRLTRDIKATLSSVDVTVKYVNKNGALRCHGGSRLKETQEYTREFGKSVAQLKVRYTKKFHLKPAARRPVHTLTIHQSTRAGQCTH